MNDCYVIIIFALCLISLIVWFVKLTKRLWILEGYDDNVPDVSFPFKNMFDSKGKKLNIILISAPFREEAHEKLYEEYRSKGLLLCGISSYQNFPDKISNPYEDKFHEQKRHDYPSMVAAWLHCFRELPPVLLNSKLPVLLMTEADLKNCKHLSYEKKVNKEYDFMYLCLQDNDECRDGWQSYNRNWELAKKCIVIMCRDFGLRGLLVGRTNCELGPECKDLITIKPFLEYHIFQEEMQKCRFLFIPNISDASPRIATEAMCYNIPVLMNYNIIGGWHNIIPGITGEFFRDESDISISLIKIINYTKYQPKQWFMKNRGREISGHILAEFLIAVFGRDKLNSSDLSWVYISI